MDAPPRGRPRAILRDGAAARRRGFRFRAARRRGKLGGVKARRRAASALRRGPADAGDPSEYRLVRRTADACRRNYLGRRDVLDVGVGLKYRAGRRSGEGLCVQFCVRRKLRRPGARRLPRFVFARRRNGALDRGRRVATDVIALGRPRFLAGARLRSASPRCAAASRQALAGARLRSASPRCAAASRQALVGARLRSASPRCAAASRQALVGARLRSASPRCAAASRPCACAAGTPLEAPGELGTLTLLFRNRPDGRFYGLTCAHVAGSLESSPPADPRLASACCRARVFATTVANSVAERGVVDWDIAIARLEPGCTPQPERRVEGSRCRLRRLRAASAILPGSFVECAAARSGRFPAVVSSDARSLRLRLDRTPYRVRNLFLIEARLLPGDSGGLVFDADEAIGTLVAVAGGDAPGRTGFGLFQPLEGALGHLAERCGFPLRCFD
jgi:hypothetical protein